MNLPPVATPSIPSELQQILRLLQLLDWTYQEGAHQPGGGWGGPIAIASQPLILALVDMLDQRVPAVLSAVRRAVNEASLHK